MSHNQICQFLYIKEGRGQKAHIFNLSPLRESKHGVCRNVSISALLTKTLKSVSLSSASSPAALFGKGNDGAMENNHPLPLILLLFVWRQQSALGILTDNDNNVFIN